MLHNIDCYFRLGLVVIANNNFGVLFHQGTMRLKTF